MIPKLDLLIAVDYWSPNKSFRYAYPWIVPGAIVRLMELLRPDMTVLEFGAGGSTLFFSARCRSVVSYETNEQWVSKVQMRLAEEDIHNVTVQTMVIGTELVTVKTIADQYDVVLLDSAPAGPRKTLLPLLWERVRVGGLLVVDNYNASGVRQSILPPGWAMECYDDPHWLGWGTAIARRMV